MHTDKTETDFLEQIKYKNLVIKIFRDNNVADFLKEGERNRLDIFVPYIQAETIKNQKDNPDYSFEDACKKVAHELANGLG